MYIYIYINIHQQNVKAKCIYIYVIMKEIDFQAFADLMRNSPFGCNDGRWNDESLWCFIGLHLGIHCIATPKKENMYHSSH